jgi:DNA adenine methylase
MQKEYRGIPRYYYDLRNIDRDRSRYDQLSDIQKAARTIFLNKTCYNGLYRVNSKGEFNTPMGRYKNPQLYDMNNIIALSKYFQQDNVVIKQGDYQDALDTVQCGDIIYFDPPYHYENDDGFTLYQKEGFDFEDFIRLKAKCDECLSKEAYVLISNNETSKIRALFEKDPQYIIYDLHNLETKRMINSKGNLRNTGKELLIVGFPAKFPQANSLPNIIKIIKSHEESFQDTEKIKEVLGVKTYRTVHYYLSSLKYLGIINNEKRLSEFGMRLRSMNNGDFKKELSSKIISMGIFKEVYSEENMNPKLTCDEIAAKMGYLQKNYSKNTLLRRASTVRTWVDWSWNILGGENEHRN